MISLERIRRFVQHAFSLLINSHFYIFGTAPIYQGNLKYVCTPVLNCYSCPLAVTSCPIGALQSALATLRPTFRAVGGGIPQAGLYILGSLGLVASVVGRMPCGWLCPFGLIQEYLFKVRTRKLALPRWSRHVRYAVLAIFVVLLPLFWIDSIGFGETTFCKFICPAGTLEAGIPLLALRPELRQIAGVLFGWKFLVLVAIVVASIYTSRPFCRTICPLGAILGLFNRISLVRLHHDKETCVECGACRTICPTGVSFYDGTDSANSPSCIRCLRCYSICPVCAISVTTEQGRKVINQCTPKKRAAS